MRQKLVGEPAATCGYRKSYPGWRRPLQDDKLLAEKCCFGLPSRMRSEQSDEQSAEQLQEVMHPEARITHRGICASPDTIFGSHTSSAPGIKREIFTTSGRHCRALRLAGSASDAGAGRSKALAGARFVRDPSGRRAQKSRYPT